MPNSVVFLLGIAILALLFLIYVMFTLIEGLEETKDRPF